MMNRTQNLSLWFFIPLALFLCASFATAQEQSVKPGINDNFKGADVDRYIERFEGEDRVIYKFRGEIVDALGLKPGMDVVDIGAGTGFFSLMMAEEVAPGGTIHAVDIAENFIQHIEEIAAEQGVTNVKPSVCSERSIDLPEASVDLAFVCDTYHHFEYPFDTLASIHKALRPDGILVIVDFERVKGVTSDFSINHVRCGKGTVTDEVKNSGFEFVEEVDLMEGQYVIKFKKRASSADE